MFGFNLFKRTPIFTLSWGRGRFRRLRRKSVRGLPGNQLRVSQRSSPGEGWDEGLASACPWVLQRSSYRSAPLIVVQGVTKRYDGEPALADVSIAVARGEFAFLIGTNGAGKTTLLRILLREEPFDAGVVLVNGVDVSRIRGAALTKFRRRIGVVFQDTRLLPNATVRENVGLPLQVRGRATREIDTAVTQVLERVALADKSERFPRQLSGGEQRKVALARAVIAKPDILLCDEPTDSINPTHAREIMGLLLEINSDGVTTLVATHDSEIVNNLRRRVIRMDAGAILADEPVGVFNSG